MESLTLVLVVVVFVLAAAAAGLQAYAAIKRRRLMDSIAAGAAGLGLGALAAVAAREVADDLRRRAGKKAAEDAAFKESLRKILSELDDAMSAVKADAAASARPASDGRAGDSFCACGRRKSPGYFRCRQCADAVR